jgi:hypothetical protein
VGDDGVGRSNQIMTRLRATAGRFPELVCRMGELPRYLTASVAGERLGIGHDLVSVDAGGVEAAADWDSLWSPETTSALRAPRTSPPPTERSWTPRTPMSPPRGWPSTIGPWPATWTVGRQAIMLNEAGGRIAYRFHARDLHLVMGPPAPGTSVRFRVHLDGQLPGAAHGTDVDEQGNGTVTQPRLHQLIRQPGPITDRTMEVTFVDPGVQAYAFTFG